MRLLVIAAALTVTNGQSAMEEECRREITSPVFTNSTLRDAVARFWEDKSTAESIYGPMKCWNVAEVTDMEALFSADGLVGLARTSQAAFNEPIEFWVVDKVTNMKDMFKSATNFRQRLQGWDPRRVTSMNGMFFYAQAFNQDLGWCLHSSVDLTAAFDGSMCALTTPPCGVDTQGSGSGTGICPFPTPIPTAAPSISPVPTVTPVPSGAPSLVPTPRPSQYPTLTRCKECSAGVFESKCEEGTKEAKGKWDTWDCMSEDVCCASNKDDCCEPVTGDWRPYAAGAAVAFILIAGYFGGKCLAGCRKKSWPGVITALRNEKGRVVPHLDRKEKKRFYDVAYDDGETETRIPSKQIQRRQGPPETRAPLLVGEEVKVKSEKRMRKEKALKIAKINRERNAKRYAKKRKSLEVLLLADAERREARLNERLDEIDKEFFVSACDFSNPRSAVQVPSHR